MQLKEQAHLSWECQNELFRQEVEGADDIRLNAPLVSKCMGDKKRFCDGIAPGRELCVPGTLWMQAMCNLIESSSTYGSRLLACN